MSKQRKIKLFVCTGVIIIVVVLTGCLTSFMQRPTTRLAMLFWDGMSKGGLFEQTLSMREDDSCLSQSVGTLRVNIPILGTKTIDFETQLSEEGLKIRFANEPDKVYLYDHTDPDKHGLLVKLLGQEVTDGIDYWLKVMAGEEEKTDYSAMSKAVSKKDLIFITRDILSDIQIIESPTYHFYVNGKLEELNGYEVVLSGQQCKDIWQRYISLLPKEQRKHLPPFEPDKMMQSDEIRLYFYYKGRHLAAVQLADEADVVVTLTKTKEKWPQISVAGVELGTDTKLSMDVMYLPKSEADTYADAILDIGNFSLSQLPGLFQFW